MINKNLILAALGSLALQNAVAQSTSHLSLSDSKPKPNEKITVTYDPAGTPLAGENGLNGVVYFLDNKDYPAADLELKPNGKQLKGEFTVPANAKAFFVKIFKDDKIDDNSEKGYTYYVYNGAAPVEGAYASKAYMLYSGMGEALGKIKTDKLEAASLYKQEFAAHPGAEKEYRTNYYSLLASDKNPESANLLTSAIGTLEKSNDEKDLVAAYGLYVRTGKKAKADSLSAVIKAKFPNGDLTKNDLGMAFNREQDLKKKEALYSEYVNKYPEKADDKFSTQDNFRLQLAMAYLKADDMAGFEKWAAQIKSNKVGLANTLNSAAWKWAEAGTKLDEAAVLSKRSLDIMSGQIKNPEAGRFSSPSMVVKNAQNSYDMYADTYAYILYKQGNFKEAIAYEKPVYERAKDDGEIAQHYAMMLKGAGDMKQVQQVLEQAMKNGKASVAMTDLMKEAYVKNKGTDKGFEEYVTSLKGVSAAATRAKLAKQMINQPAPVFALKDFDGNTVSLASLKGKVVVVDFWATWCGPCKASFPGMQMAVNKYQSNPNVKFLFIDTWENGDNFNVDGAKKFIADNKYSFYVLMDEKGSDGRQSKVVSSFGVTGIPTKFVIDGAGAIRFKHVGYSGSDAAVLDEISAMVDMALSPDAVTNAAKVTKLEE
ncbi:redoxin domain-containing protein [Mucilaginibacter sp. CSA2-8R]|uniref:redoxin domain-containing protein n=1 Tax=Mucilaginibacter sp. CSA2-8R TaxID=3141542 RepID=UPI00315C8BBD